jgi:hypothetical protein
MGVDLLAELQDMFMHRTVGRCCSYSRRWTLPEKTERSSTSCPVSTRRVARSILSRRKPRKPRSRLPLALSEMLPERDRIGIFNRSCSRKLAGASPSGAVRGGLCVCHTGYRVPTPGFDSGGRLRPGFGRPAREHESLGSGSRDQADIEWVSANLHAELKQ